MQVKKQTYILRGIFAGRSDGRGRGMFTRNAIPSGKIIETAPVIVFPPEHRPLLDQTLLHDYIFEWGPEQKQCCVALGYVSLYNHAYNANCDYEMDFDNEIMRIRTVREIAAGEELFINYNGAWDDEKKIWFEAT